MSGQLKVTSPVPRNFVAEMARMGWSTTETARRLKVSERQVTRWRGGQVPRYSTVARMAKVFGRETVWFYTADHDDEAVAA